MKAKKPKKVSYRLPQKLEKAQADFRKIWQEIAPFVRKREIKQYSTGGDWRSSCFDY